MALQPGVGLGLHYNMSPSLLIPCSVSPFVYSHLSQVRRHVIQPSCAKYQVRDSRLLSASSFIHYVPRLIVSFQNKEVFLWGEVVSLMPNPQPGGPGYPLSSGPSPSTCPARVTLPVANAAADLALRIIWPCKPCHLALAFDKVERGNRQLHSNKPNGIGMVAKSKSIYIRR
jgi:hypothetical protein